MKIAPFLLLLLFGVSALAQSPSKSSIINSREYYYGTGVSTDENRALNDALRGLSEMISVTVKSNFEQRAKEVNMQVEEFAESIVETYSTATLKNVKQIRTILPDGQTEIFCYLSGDAVKQLYDDRAEMAYQMYQNSLENIKAGQLAFALKNLFFGNLLVKSLPNERVIFNGKEISLEIPQTLNSVMQGVTFRLTADRMISSRERQLSFDVTYLDKPISLLHFRFWDGNQLAGNGQVRDGKTTLKLVGNSVEFDELKVFVEYMNYNSRQEFKAVEDLWELVKLPVFKNEFTIDLTQSANSPDTRNIPTKTELMIKADKNVDATGQVLLAANSFISVLEKGQETLARDQYANDGFLCNKISAYMSNNHPVPAQGVLEANVNKTRSGFELRKVMVNHYYPSLHKQATEYLVMDFDTAGTLVDFNLCITDDLYEKFVQQAEYGDDWGNRQEIIKFIEKYRTAFICRDIETINLMFADEALILVGRKIQPRMNPASEVTYQQLPGQPGFEQIQLTKRDYIERQRRIFGSQKDIFIDFSTFEIIKKNNADKVYGVEMRQNYSSTTYADEGYLFLLIDFNGIDPLIYIRAWQPNEWDSAALVNTSNFRIYK
jgi:hypothetical protein